MKKLIKAADITITIAVSVAISYAAYQVATGGAFSVWLVVISLIGMVLTLINDLLKRLDISLGLDVGFSAGKEKAAE